MKMNPNEDNQYFRTADLPLAVSLCVRGFVICDIEQIDPKRSVFVFENSDKLASAVSDFWSGKLRVEPQEYFNKLKSLKARLYQR